MSPVSYSRKLSELVAQIERNEPMASIDIEQNSLEDAFINIAERDIKKEEQKADSASNEKMYLTPEQEE